ncbi:unnamed protein product [Prorocentrum cordatum]|nr:unnamed protein product [Polarella glacialis]
MAPSLWTRRSRGAQGEAMPVVSPLAGRRRTQGGGRRGPAGLWALSLLARGRCTEGLPAECEAFGEGFYTQAEQDFAPFRGLSEWDAQRTRNLCRQQGRACFVVKVIGGRVHISEEQPGFQSRNRITQAFLQRVVAKHGPLPDAEFVVDTSDGYSSVEAPLFVIAKFPQSAGGILYPDFSSFAWPESECPTEPPGAHVWHRTAEDLLQTPQWEEKVDQLFWRGAATSAVRKQVVPHIGALQGTNVSFLEWGRASSGRQGVVDGTCVPLAEWCRYRYLANLPGNTMALSFKHRLLCGSVVVTSPLWYHEWFYSQLHSGEHFVEVDPAWKGAGQVLRELRADEAAARSVATAARDWARRHLTEEAFDCYWLRLVQLAATHFPPPKPRADMVPLEHALLAPQAAAPPPPPLSVDALGAKPQVDVFVVIPARVADAALMASARSTWLRGGCGSLTLRHRFVLASEDVGAAEVAADAEAAAEPGTGGGDVMVVECAHGYTGLLRKMALAYRALLASFDVAVFARADVDSVLPLPLLLPLAMLASRGGAVVRTDGSMGAACAEPLWRRASVGTLGCQTECAVRRQCRFFSVGPDGECALFAKCPSSPPGGLGGGRGPHDTSGSAVYEYGLRALLRDPLSGHCDAPVRPGRPFILGTVLHGNKVLVNDTHNPQWNNPRYTEDLGLSVYPPYPEASGYFMSAAVAAFIAGIGDGILASLSWKAWAIEDAALGTALAGLDVPLLQLPAEARDHIRVIKVRAA